MAMNLLRLVILLSSSLFHLTSSIDCTSITSSISSMSSGANTQGLSCPITTHTLVSCGFKSNDNGDKNIRGSYINPLDGLCYARNGFSSTGVYAIARCCDLTAYSISCQNYQSQPNDNSIADSKTYLQCLSTQSLLGCTSRTNAHRHNGNYPKTGDPIWTSTILSEPDACAAWSYEDGISYSFATCCSSNNGAIFQCESIWSGETTDQYAIVSCPNTDQFMSSCSGSSERRSVNQWEIENNNQCIVRNGSPGLKIIAVAICCSISNPTSTPTSNPTSKPTSITIPPTPSTSSPTVSTITPTNIPTPIPTKIPSTTYPTEPPTRIPTPNPTESTPNPTEPTPNPTKVPSTTYPTEPPTRIPTKEPTPNPTDPPTKQPTKEPTKEPTDTQTTSSPTNVPTKVPTKMPTINPTQTPTENETKYPSTASPVDSDTFLKATGHSETTVTNTVNSSDAKTSSSTLAAIHAVEADTKSEGDMFYIIIAIAICIGLCCCVGCICYIKSKSKSKYKQKEKEKQIPPMIGQSSAESDPAVSPSMMIKRYLSNEGLNSPNSDNSQQIQAVYDEPDQLELHAKNKQKSGAEFEEILANMSAANDIVMDDIIDYMNSPKQTPMGSIPNKNNDFKESGVRAEGSTLDKPLKNVNTSDFYG